MGVRMAPKLEPAPAGLDRDTVVYMAKVAEYAERYEDMMAYTKQIPKVVPSGDDVTDEERNLISISFKNVMSLRRGAVRTALQMAKTIPEDPSIKPWVSDCNEQCEYFKNTEAKALYELIQEVSEEIVSFFTKGP